MAGTTKEMSTIKQVLRYHLEGISNRKTAQLVGLNKETVNKYVNIAKADSMTIKELLKLDDPILEGRFRGGNPAYTDARFEDFKNRLPYLVKEMANRKKTHVTLELLWQEYKKERPDGYSLTQFRYHYRQNVIASKEVRASTTLKVLHQPGAKIYIDFTGDKMYYIDKDTGEYIYPEVFVASLPYSDYTFALAVPTQRAEDFIFAITQCFKFLGGVPHVIVPDNLKAAVIKPDKYQPKINRILQDMANHYECRIEPARSYHPKDKPNAEGDVKIIYQRVYAALRKRQFFSLEELNEAISEKIGLHNQKRMQQNDYSREERFLAKEKPALKPLPENDFEILSYSDHKVGINGFIYMGGEKRYYSVPHIYINQEVKVISSRSIIKIYYNCQLIATHERPIRGNDKYIYKDEHLASHSREYRGRSKEQYIAKGHYMLRALGEFIENMFITSSGPDETLYKSCDSLIHLAKETTPEIVEKACLKAMELQNYKLGFVTRLIKSQCKGLNENIDTTASMAPPKQHEGIRGKSAFQ